MSDEPRRLSRDSLYPLLAGLLALASFLPGIDWGLPSRDDDRFLFGGRQPWTGAQIIELAGGLDADSGRGADVDANPLDSTSGPGVLNDTDAKRAEIVRRYRLFSHQPDEFINFAAIAGMAQRRDADPRLYQYGGLWIYPVAGLLGAASAVGYVELRGDMGFYLDAPEEFGKFYVVARLYSAMWGAIGAGVVFVIVRRLTAGPVAAFCAAIAFALLPVVVTAAHEAKPHLAGAVLLLLAVVKADDYVRTARRHDALWAGVLCGAASAMVISMVVGFAVLPVMALLRWRRGRMERERVPPAEAGETPGADARLSIDDRASLRHAIGAPALGLLAYVATNPYVVYHVLFDRAIFQSNIGNSTAMYRPGDIAGGIVHGTFLLAIAAGTLFFFALVLAVIVFAARRTRLGARAWLLITAGAAVLVFFFPLGAGKPAEYARFGIVPMTVLVIAYFAVVGRGLFPLPAQRRWLCVLGVLLVAISGVPYIVNFIEDRGGVDTRTRAAERLAQHASEGGEVLNLWAEPAPWSAPPFDLWKWQAVLDSDRADARIEIVEAPRDEAGVIRGRFITPISWANKPVQVKLGE